MAIRLPHSRLSELLPRETLGRLQADCATIVGGAVVMFRSDGSTMTDLYAASPYCRTIVSLPRGQEMCMQSRRDLAMEAMATGQTQEANCHAGVPIVAIPLIVSGEAVAATVISIKPAPGDRDILLETARSMGTEPGLLQIAARKAPPLPENRARGILRIVENLHRIHALQITSLLETEQVKRQATQSANRVKALYNTTRAISSTLSLEQTARIVVEQMTITAGLDRCLLGLLDARDPRRRDEGEIPLRPAAAHGLTTHESRRFHEQQIIDLGIRAEWWDRLERSRVVVLPEGWLRQTPMKAVFPAPEERRGMLVPVVSGGTLWAVAYLDGARNADQLTTQEVDLSLTIAGQAGIAIANIKQYEQEQRVARTLQESLLSVVPPKVERYSIGYLYQPALAEAQVGGDFYDLVKIDDSRFAILIGDVSGKGIDAAVHTGMMKYMARGLMVDDPTPASLVTRLNRAVARQYDLNNNFITFCYALIDCATDRFTCTNAGHEPPLLYHAHLGESTEMAPNGPAIGLIDDFSYTQSERALGEGDGFLLYTDGAVEARSPDGGFYGSEGLSKSLHRVVKLDGPEVIRALYQDLLRYTGGRLQDDLALLMLKR